MIGPSLMAAMAMSQPVDAAEAKGRLAMQKYAECVAHKSKQLASVVAEVDPFRMSIRQKQQVHLPECLVEIEDSMTAKPAIYRYAMAEVLVHQKNGMEAPDVASAAPIDHPSLAEDAPMTADWISIGGTAENWPKERAANRRDSVIASLGDCVVRAAPAASWSLLGTKIASDAEKGAMQKLAPTIGQCLPAGQQMSLLKAEVRGAIALNYYLLAKAPRIAAGTVH